MRLIHAAIATAALLATLTACGTSQQDDSKYRQTWTADYSATSCAEYLDDMSRTQRWAAAADMLTSARSKIDGGSGLPADAAITRFEQDIATACQGETTATIAEVAATIYRMDPSYRP